VMAVIALTRGGGSNPASPSTGASANGTPPAAAAPPIDSLVELNPTDGTIGRTVKGLPVGCGARNRIAVGEGAIWWRACTSIAHVDLDSGQIEDIINVPYGPVGTGGDILTASRTVWMPAGAKADYYPAVARIDPATDETLRPIAFPKGNLVSSIVFAEGKLWTGFRDGTLRGLDPATGKILETFRLPGEVDELAFGDGSLWALDSFDRNVKRVNLRTQKVDATIDLGSDPSDITAGPQGVWVLSSSLGAVIPINPVSNEAGSAIRVGDSPTAIVEGFGATWVSDQDGFVRRIDPRSHQITRLRVGAPLGWIAVDGLHHDLWVAVGTLEK
jgi:streptogramin lyase